MSRLYVTEQYFMCCISCGSKMPGIFSYDIREICRPCGGFAKERTSEDEENVLEEIPHKRENKRQERIEKMRERARLWQPINRKS